MCRPASFVIVNKATKNKPHLVALWDRTISESHEDIIEYFKLPETNVRDEVTLVRVEIVPPDNNYTLPLKKWEYRLDQDTIPQWYDAAESEKAARTQLKEWLKAKIVLPGQKRDAITGNDYVVIVFGEVYEMRENSQVHAMWKNSQIHVMRENSQVREMLENSQIHVMRENSQVYRMWENSQVYEMWGNSQIGTMRGNSQVHRMWENSQIHVMRENSQVYRMWESHKFTRCGKIHKFLRCWKIHKFT